MSNSFGPNLFRHQVTSALVILLVLASARGATAQQNAVREADQLHARATALQANRSRLVSAARLYLREAEVRGVADPQTVKSLNVAAHLLYYANRRGEARRVMERAAETALGQGDVGVAALTYVLVAWMAQADQQADEVRRLAQRAEVLASSPLVAATERISIMSRLSRTAISTR